MLRKLLLPLFLISCIVAFAQYNVGNTAPSTNGSGQQSLSPRTILELGKISKADIISKELVLTNTESKPIAITSVILPTGKLKVEYQKDPILPGKSGIINLTLYTQDLASGLFSKTIRVKTNGTPSSYRIDIRADISDEIPPRQNRADGIQWVRIYSNGKFGAEVKSKNVIKPMYESLSYNFILQLFIGLIDNQLNLLDVNGNVLGRTEFQEYNVDKTGVILKNNRNMGYISKSGMMIIPFSQGYTSISHHFNEVGEYFQFKKSNTTGILDKKGNVAFEISNLSNEERWICPYYISNKLLYVSNDGIFDNNGNKVASFNRISHAIFDAVYILDNGDIVTLSPTEENLFNTEKIGSIFDLKLKNSVNPYK